ncbi:hypothetical protein BOW28_09665 [Solemya velum gill symbiont]|uniref:DUF6776 family protein n=1 Tax=Solemya velum gill symbiont TaxID=2340 RepID=UPI00099781AC|nr:DUF6776 family protein [Solemya velum gill symbiont]OOZ16616.1 hypothetical protein BOW28_09665 [Solemya velum gill symbiont]OOZ26719.1 hypothetical protein BOW32_06945 [Solemya velum gill symbiont]
MEKPVKKKARRVSMPSANMISKIAISVAFVAIVWLFWSMGEEVNVGGKDIVIRDRAQAVEVVGELQKTLEQVTRERDTYRQQVIMMERSFQIDREVAKTLREELKALQSERHKWREETALVKKLLSDNTIDTALDIKSIEVVPSEIIGEYHFEIAVSRLPDSDKPVKAELHYELIGNESGLERRYLSSDVDLKAKEGYQLEFRTLERVQGHFMHPPAFELEKIRFFIEGKDDKIQGAEKDFVPTVAETAMN